jgi:carboxypeptidase C (cathepsin A)
MDPLDKEAQYDPQSAAISAAYVAGFNNYVRKTLNYGMDKTYKEEIDVFKSWNFKHQPPGADMPLPFAPDVLPDLAAAIKYNPTLKVQLNAGYFDLATPFYEGVYEMAHLPMPARLQANIEYRQYESGHMVYVHVPALKQLHDNVADFIRRTDNLGTTPPAPVATH